LEIVVRAPPHGQAHVDGAMDVSKYLLQSMQVGVRGRCLCGAKNAQRRGNMGTRANGRVLETAREAGVDVLGHPVKGVKSCARGRRGSRGL
jgi:hypothetical protein